MREAMPMTKAMLMHPAVCVPSTPYVRCTVGVSTAMHMSCAVSVPFAMPSTMTVTPTSVENAVCAREGDH
jgi:hypothetical protein